MNYRSFVDWLKHPAHLIAVFLALIPIYSVGLYAYTYGMNIPIDEDWYKSLDLAVATKDGTLTVSDITDEYSGHRPIFTHLAVVGLSYFTDWYRPAEVYLIFMLALLRLGVVIAIFHVHLSSKTHFAMIPLAFLIFSAYLGISWVSGISSVWHFVSFFSLSAIWVLLYLPVGWRGLILAALLGVFTTYSQGSGIIIFPVLALTLWMFGYRRWHYYLFWIIVSFITLYFYINGSSIAFGGTTSTQRTAINFNSLPLIIQFLLAFQGNTFSYRLGVNFSTLLGAAGSLILCGNLLYLWIHTKDWRQLAGWVTMAGYSFSIALIIFLTRYRDFMGNAIVPRYAIVSTQFWMAVLSSSLIVFFHSYSNKPRWVNWLVISQVAITITLAALYLPATIGVFQTTTLEYGYPLRHHYAPPESCIRDFVLYRYRECLNLLPIKKASEDGIYKLAYYGLSIFRDAQPHNLMPTTYTTGQPVILDVPNLWMGVYLNKWYLGDMPEQNVLYLAPPSTEPTEKIQNLPHVGDNQLEEFVSQADTLWYVRTRETETNAAKIHEQLESLGYIHTPFTIADYRYGSEITITRYDLKPNELAELFQFGDVLSMQHFSLLSEYTIASCGEVRLKSWWINTNPSDSVYSASLTVVNQDGVIIGSSDEGLAYSLPIEFWERGKLYVDERTITISCDAPPGKYDLLFGVYTLNPVQDLPITLADGSPIGNRAYLTSIFVE